jgi:hypothetical protein
LGTCEEGEKKTYVHKIVKFSIKKGEKNVGSFLLILTHLIGSLENIFLSTVMQVFPGRTKAQQNIKEN